MFTVPMTVRSMRPVSESELTRVEHSLGVSIPNGYRTFLQATDGGRPVEDTFSPKIGVTNFLGAREIVKERARLRGRISVPGSSAFKIDPDFLKMVREQEEQENKRPTLQWPRVGTG